MDYHQCILTTLIWQINYPNSREKRYLTSHSWGSLFTDQALTKADLPDNKKDKVVENTEDSDDEELKRMNTLWGFVIRKYADLAVPQLEYITG